MAKSRLLFVDNLRTLVIVLVILVHLSITYGGEGGWYYNEGPKGTLSSILLTWFNATCQSFFMGLLFLLSAYFTADACERKAPRRFAKDRLLRLGIPMLVYDWVLHPLAVCSLMRTGYHGPERLRVALGWASTSARSIWAVGRSGSWRRYCSSIWSICYGGG